MANGLFWLIAALIAYIYVGYPVLVFLLSFVSRRKTEAADCEPEVSLIITAYNEERAIREKLENTLALNYPPEKLQIIVASDGSTDRTDEIVESFPAELVRLLRVEGRVGKTEAQNQAVRQARGAIILFSDAATLYSKDVIRKLVRNYASRDVGAVSGRYEYVNPNGSAIGFCSALIWRYENWLKRSLSRIGTLTGCCGCIYSIRRELYRPLPRDVSEDFVQALSVIAQGYRVIFEPEALAFEPAMDKPGDEFNRRVRSFTRGIRGILYMRALLNPFVYPFVAFELISHKTLRWLTAPLCATLLCCNLFLLDSDFFRAVFACQILFLAAGIAGVVLLRTRGRSGRLLSLPTYFVVVLSALAVAITRVASAKRYTTWEPSR